MTAHERAEPMNVGRRDFLAGAAAAGAMALVPGCGGSADGSSRPHAAPAAPGDPIGRFTGQRLTLSRWSGDPWTSAQQKAAARWGRVTGGHINISAVPYENLHDKQVLSLVGAGDYDILYLHPSSLREFARAELLAPIDSMLDDPRRNPRGRGSSSYVPNVLAQSLHDGRHYGLPDFVSTIVVAYRTDVLEAAGITALGTVPEILTAARTLNGKNGMAGITLPGKATGAVADVMATLLAAQDTWWFDEDEQPSLDTAAATAAVNFYVEAAKYTPKGLFNVAVDDVATLAAQGRAAMVVSTTPSLQALEDPAKSRTAGRWGYLPIAYTADRPGGELIYWMWCIAARSGHKDAAYSFLRWYTDTAQQSVIARESGTAGATKDFYQAEELAADLPFLPALNKALGNARPQPNLPWWPQAQNDIEVAVQNAISGDSSVPATVRALRHAMTSAQGS
ncbi:extracellular solute-binding protein [Streptomyces sp. NPDC026672]|uniref:ABC transporter substrate-binding protein n=1 Tax=unclassified Streptomyces TaxID=2593676 RepID=UPI00340E90BB